MSDYVFGTIILIFAVACLVGFFSPRGDRFTNGFVAMFISLQISFVGWTIYVVVHFASKYW